MIEKTLTATRLRELLDYDPATGAFVWKAPQSHRVAAGDEAGAVAANGRRYISVDGRRYMAHHLAWLFVTGEWPAENVATNDGDYLNTRFENLKLETASETARKGAARKVGASGVKGVSWDKSRGKWIASITRNYRQVNLGRFDTKAEAEAAYGAASDKPVERPDHAVVQAKAGAVRKRYVQRQMWKRTLANAGGITGWGSLDDFLADVGEAPVEGHVLAPLDAAKPIGPGNFAWAAASWTGFDHKTAAGRSAYQRAHRGVHRDLYRDKDLRKTFGISLVDYQRMHDAQNGCCAICAQPETLVRHGKLAALAVDHDHATGAVRALLCDACNKAVGLLRDSPDLLRRAAAYLERHAAPGNVVRLHPSFPPTWREHVIPVQRNIAA